MSGSESTQPSFGDHVQYMIETRSGYVRAECTCGWYGAPRVHSLEAVNAVMRDYYAHTGQEVA